MKTAPTLSIRDLQLHVSTLVSNAVIRRPNVPAAILADELADETEDEPEFDRQLSRMLKVGLFSRAIRTERIKERRRNVPEQFAHLPLRVRLPDGSSVWMDEMTYSQARAYYFSLGARHDSRKADDPKRAEAKALMDALHGGDRGITAGRLLGFDFGDLKNAPKKAKKAAK
jgi:hypothetical protein